TKRKSSYGGGDDPYEKVITIFHSSGSTSFPKLVPLTNRYFLVLEQRDKAGDVVLATAPLFHIFGMSVSINTIFYPGSVYVFPIVSGSVPLINKILHSLNQSKSNVFYTLPAIIEQIYKNHPEEIKTLLKLSSIKYAGAALSPQIGKKLIQSGVNVQSMYSSTETGVIMDTSKNSSSPNIPWNAINLVVPETKELIIEKRSPYLSNIKGNTENGGYRTGDFFLETSKDTIRLNQFVKQVVVVGFNRPFNCLFIELDYENIKLTPFLDVTKSIFDSVHQANNDCPSHSRIFDEMIYILPLEGKTIAHTLKNNVQYSLKSAIGDSFSLTDDDEASFFAIGLDSLSATKLRAILQKQFPVINLPHDIIFEYNTFQSLTHYLIKELSKNSSPQGQNAEDSYEAKLQALKNEVNSYIQKYSATDNFPPVDNSDKINGIVNEKNGETVLITGVTGSLGSFILYSFEQRHLDSSLLSKEHIIILPSDLGDSKFGQTEKIYSKLVQEVTQIYHVAWRLDFNNKIQVFERDSIAGTVHLLMLAREAYTHHQNVHFNFTSSISTTVRSKTNVKEDELPHDISSAMINGYALSKFITEN
ncbi:659_t:CDS:2, partial [Dentiscutata erythropus]